MASCRQQCYDVAVIRGSSRAVSQEDHHVRGATVRCDDVTEIYERVLVQPLFRPFAEELIARLRPVQGDNLIDVACGTGIAARVAREKLGSSARIVGVDVAPAMLAVARKVEPTIDWREGNATSLPIGAAVGWPVRGVRIRCSTRGRIARDVLECSA
jgi:SAM-dependent methyltransferase